jgi:protein AATF/BFR2
LQKSAERSATISSLEELSELLFDVRQRMHEKNDKLAFDSALQDQATRKRKRGSSAYVSEAVNSLSSISTIVSPYEKATVSKWSDKVASATGGASEQNKFKALGTQNTWSQIENILSQDMPRLVERSKARKGNGGKAMKVVGRVRASSPARHVFRLTRYIFTPRTLCMSQ